MENIILWLQLHYALGGTVAGGKLLRKFKTAEAVFAVSPEAREKAGELTPETAEKLRQALRLRSEALSVAATCRHFGWQVITPENSCYPAAFRILKDPPLALFAAGDPTFLVNGRRAAVVGTREPADRALRAAYDIGAALSEAGIVTVSGGALGVDSAAHEGALTGDGGTVSVLGSGIASTYLPEKVFLRRRIQKQGVLISELEPFQPPTHNTFPRRNRLIAALGETLTVVQSGLRGGSMITAKYAQNMERPVYALSPEVFSSQGCGALISRGAVSLDCAGKLLSFYGCGAQDGIPLDTGYAVPRVLTPEKCTLAEFAMLNRVTPGEAAPLYEEICRGARAGNVSQIFVPPMLPPQYGAEKPKQPSAAALNSSPARDAGPKPAASSAEAALASLKQRIADAQKLPEDQRAVFMALQTEPLGLDDLAAQTGLSSAALMTALTALELADLAQTHPGNRASVKLG